VSTQGAVDGVAGRCGGAAGDGPHPRIDRGLSAALTPLRRPLAVHDPGKVVCDLAVMLTLGGDCLADVALLREQPGVFGRVASDPTVSRLVDALAKDGDRALAAIATARAQARRAAWKLAGTHAPDAGTDARSPLVVDLDATLITAHSDKEGAAPTFKRGYGHHPLWAFVDHVSGRHRRAAGGAAAAGQRRVQHRRRPHHRHPPGIGPAPRPGW